MPIEVLIVVPLGLFVALAITFVLLLRRAGRVLAATREWDAFRRSVLELAGRIDLNLGPIASVIDEVRHQRLTADALEDGFAPAIAVLEGHVEEVHALRVPPAYEHVRADLVVELERAARALEMVEHGQAMLAVARRGDGDLEAQTSLKRGYLNLIHAREAIATHAAAVPAAPTASGDRSFFSRPTPDPSGSTRNER